MGSAIALGDPGTTRIPPTPFSIRKRTLPTSGATRGSNLAATTTKKSVD